MGSLRLSLPAQHPPIGPRPREKDRPLGLALQLLDHRQASLPLPRSRTNTHSQDTRSFPVSWSRTTAPSAWTGSPGVTHTHLIRPEHLQSPHPSCAASS